MHSVYTRDPVSDGSVYVVQRSVSVAHLSKRNVVVLDGSVVHQSDTGCMRVTVGRRRWNTRWIILSMHYPYYEHRRNTPPSTGLVSVRRDAPMMPLKVDWEISSDVNLYAWWTVWDDLVTVEGIDSRSCGDHRWESVRVFDGCSFALPRVFAECVYRSMDAKELFRACLVSSDRGECNGRCSDPSEGGFHVPADLFDRSDSKEGRRRRGSDKADRHCDDRSRRQSYWNEAISISSI